MAALELLFSTKTKAKVMLVELDASIDETHVSRVEKSTHPVEAGADITDNLRRLPDKLTINGVISNTPVTMLASVRSRSPVGGDVGFAQDRVDIGYKELLRAKDAGEIGTVVTSLRQYENMAIVGLSVRRNSQSGNILDVTIELEETIIATTDSVEAPPEPIRPAQQQVRNSGKKSTNESDANTAIEEEGEGMLVRLSNFGKKFIGLN